MSKKKTQEEFEKEIYKKYKDEYIVKGKYINSSTKIKILHNKCNTEYFVRPYDILKGYRCPKCFGSFKKSTEQFKKEVFNLVGSEYEVIGEYIASRTKIKMKHNKCGKEYEVCPSYFIHANRRCPYCSNHYKKTKKDYINEISELKNKEYEIVNEINGVMNKCLFKHNKCGNIFYMRPNDFQQGQRCPFCKESKGEKKIKNWLDKHNYEYETQFKFPDCKYKRELPFDFKLQDDSGKIILIEYDGIQHFQESFYGNNLNEIKLRDNIKNEYCKKNNIDLYRISYKDYNDIDSILEMIANKY